MKKLIFFFFFLRLLSASAQENISYRATENISSAEKKSAAHNFLRIETAPTGDYDLTHVDIHWVVSPDTLFIAGNVGYDFTMTEDAITIYFDLSDTLTVDSIFYHGEEAAFSHSDNSIAVVFPETVTAGQDDSLRIYYHGRPAGSGFGSFSITQHDGKNNLWTLSEPYGASDWWPCKNSLKDKIDSADIFITTPSPYRAGSNGLLVEEIPSGDNITYHWETHYPIATYLIGISVSEFDVYELYAPHNADSVLFYNLIYPENYADGVSGINAILPAFQLYVSLVGDYPFKNEKYGQMQFGWGGGMEHQTMTSVTVYYFDLLVHEMAHQWFGDKVTCASWHDIWLNEGFATYMNALCYNYIDTIHIYWKLWLQEAKDNITAEPGGSVYVDDTTDVSRTFNGRLTYDKGAYVLQMLRFLLGDDTFFSALRNYLNDPTLAYSFATSSDLEEHLENEADTSLSEFFSDWLYGAGFPTYHILWTQDENDQVTLALSQNTSDPSVDFFEMPVPVRLMGDNDSMDIILSNTVQGQLYYASPSFAVRAIKIDPDLWLLTGNNTAVKEDFSGAQLHVSIYPTFATDHITIQAFGNPDDYTVFLFNAAGQKIKEIAFHSSGTPEITISVADLPAGAYIVKVLNASEDIVQKIIKE